MPTSEPLTVLTEFTGRSDDVLLVATCKPPELLAFLGDLSPPDLLALSYGDCDVTLVTAGYAHQRSENANSVLPATAS